MNAREEKSAKERILQSAVELFARKGYAACGLREIVAAAGVSVAMVNYHFGSKESLLQAIMDRFFSRIHDIAMAHFPGDAPFELKIRGYFREIVAFLRNNTDLARVSFTELPHDIPGIVDFKAERVMKIVGVFASELLAGLPEHLRRRIRPEVHGPAVMGALVSHFLVRPVIENVFDQELDDSFYESFADELADMVLYGVLHSRPEDTTQRKES